MKEYIKSLNISPELKARIIEGVKVFLWAGLSATVPIIISMLSNNPNYAWLAPVVNVVAVQFGLSINKDKLARKVNELEQ